MAILTGTFTATGESQPFAASGMFNLSLSGFGTATVKLRRSLNGGTTWGDVPNGSFTADTEKTGENAGACLLKVECTAYTSGTIQYILSSGFYGA